MEDKNLSQQMGTLSPKLKEILSQLRVAATTRGYQLYLVGGGVRDLLLERPVSELDIVVLGDASAIAKDLAETGGQLVLHPAFGTATVTLGSTRVDLSSARTESYDRPGALPTVSPGTLKDDLERRDFTVNALAVSLGTDDYGQLIDYGVGQTDLTEGLIRVIHEHSFVDDPTRIWRAVRYEQRLGFEIEPQTLKWLKRDLVGLKDLTGDRVWHELACVLQEDTPRHALVRLDRLGILKLIHPSLQADDWLDEKIRKADLAGHSSLPVRLALLTYRLNGNELEECAGYLNFSKSLRRVLQQVLVLKHALWVLGIPGISPYTIYSLLHECDPEAIEVCLIADDFSLAQKNIDLYRNRLEKVKTALTGSDLLALGVKPGPQVEELLQKLLEARLNGQVKSRAEEIALAKTIIAR